MSARRLGGIGDGLGGAVGGAGAASAALAPVSVRRSRAVLSLDDDSAGTSGSGSGLSLCWFSHAITSARCWASLMPGKVILVPGAKSRGEVSHLSRLSKVQVLFRPATALE